MDKKELAEFETIKWKSILSSRVDEFSRLISNDDVFRKYFGLDYMEKISQKSKDLSSTALKLGILYSLMVLSLFATQYGKNLDFQVLGYSFKNLESIKEYILLISALLYLVSSIFSAYETYLKNIIKECLKKTSPDVSVREFYQHLFIHEPFDILKGQPAGEKTYWHNIVDYLVYLFFVALLLFYMSIFVGFHFIQFSVIYDVFTNSSAEENPFSMFVALFACLSILISALIFIIQLPMPIVDYSVHEKLKGLERDEPEKHRALMTKRTQTKNTRETRLISVIASLVFMLTFSIYSVLIDPEVFENIIGFLFTSVIGSLFVALFSLEANNLLQKHLYKKYFKSRSQGKEDSLSSFKNLQRRIWVYRLLFPFALSFLYLAFN